MIYAAFILHGLGIGLMEAPIYTFIGEISEPSIRGILTATTTIAAALGIGLVYVLGSLMAWRSVALVCGLVPILSIVLTIFVWSIHY